MAGRTDERGTAAREIFQEVGAGGTAPPPPKPSTQVEALPERNALEIRWPNVLRVDTVMRPALEIWIQAVNAKGGFGIWCWAVAFQPAELTDILTRQGK